ncbi:MAG: exodeoxyribonuclease VII large subunit [Candidatus Saccharimonadales bacterium]
MSDRLIFRVSDFVAYLNQTLEAAYPFVTIEGELSNFRISRGRWVYFDLKDELATVRFFGTIYQLPGPLENGMILRVSGSPHLHPQYNFSVNAQSITPVGEGSIKRAGDLLKAKLAAEGLFDEDRKRLLPYPPRRIGLITAAGSAAFADFIKISRARWGGLEIIHVNVAVQGESAPGQIVAALAGLNALSDLPDVIVLTRGGGSVDDLQAFSSEPVVRAVATSRVPTLVAIGHEIDLSLAELAADKRASTPSNAAELLLPDKQYILSSLADQKTAMSRQVMAIVASQRRLVEDGRQQLSDYLERVFTATRQNLLSKRSLLRAYDPGLVLKRGYALVRTSSGELVKRVSQLKPGVSLELSLADGTIEATTVAIKKGKNA